MLTAKFGDNWKEFAKKMLTFDAVIDIAWFQGRRAIELERELESKELLISALKACSQMREYGESVLEGVEALKVIPNCALCSWFFRVDTTAVCTAQGFRYACTVYNTEECKKLYTLEKDKSK